MIETRIIFPLYGIVFIGGTLCVKERPNINRTCRGKNRVTKRRQILRHGRERRCNFCYFRRARRGERGIRLWRTTGEKDNEKEEGKAFFIQKKGENPYRFGRKLVYHAKNQRSKKHGKLTSITCNF